VIFTIGVENCFDLSIERPHDADPREHRRTAQRRDHGLQCAGATARAAEGGARNLISHGSALPSGGSDLAFSTDAGTYKPVLTPENVSPEFPRLNPSCQRVSLCA
jgi:hypothetical protein